VAHVSAGQQQIVALRMPVQRGSSVEIFAWLSHDSVVIIIIIIIKLPN
jgi:hypothetical protein